MKPIIEYTDFRKFMRDFYEEKKLRHAFSWREFSKSAGFSSSSYMKVVCDGKSKLSKVGVERTGQAMGLVGFEMDYFRAMVKFGQEETDAKKKAAFEEMRAIAKMHKVRVINSDLFDFYESWQNPTLRELAPMMPGATPGELAKKCCNEISAEEVKNSLNFLAKNDFLKKIGDNTFEQTAKSIVGNPESTQLALRDMHREMAGLAAASLDLPRSERNFTGVTMGVSKDSYERIVKVMNDCLRQVVAIANEDTNIDQVYRMNLQLFPLTHSVKENDDV
ncbi:TIGR02147 family protein [Fibrobacter sp.]|uniref:TIGR02147 family protein n=1 Tax=Fibrobacter sp. TaxID=35828 RepID=UPI00388FFD2E